MKALQKEECMSGGMMKLIKVLLIVALICSVVFSVMSRCRYVYNDDACDECLVYDYTCSNCRMWDDMKVHIDFAGFIEIVGNILPVVLLGVYVLKYDEYKENGKATGILTAALSTAFVGMQLQNLIYGPGSPFNSDITTLLLGGVAIAAAIAAFSMVKRSKGASIALVLSIVNCLIVGSQIWTHHPHIMTKNVGLVYICFTIISVICLYKNNKYKWLFTICFVLGILFNALCIGFAGRWFEKYMPSNEVIYAFENLIYLVRNIITCVALMLLFIKYPVPAVGWNFEEMKVAVKREQSGFDPEQALVALKEEYENGTISEEEYKTRRAEIISKL